MDKKLTMLMILDGFGINENEKGNAVKLANTPNIDKLMKTWPTTQIHTSGLAVGLPEGQMGNSEVGHTNIGAGTITCNYDGQKKHKVTIGEDSFIGSDSIIVAPVNIGKNAVTAAGSVITEDVNDNQIAFGRARQINKERGKD